MTATQEPPNKTRSIELATHVANYFDRGESVYDFGCGDGFYLSEIRKRVLGQCIGIESRSEIAPKRFPWIVHPVDMTLPIMLGPAGNVLCSEIGEHISRQRIPGLLINLVAHCKKKLVLVWANRQSQLGAITPMDKNEIVRMVIPKGLRYQKERSEQWHDEFGDDLWYGQKGIYIFERPES